LKWAFVTNQEEGEALAEKLEKLALKKAICDAVWNREIDQMNTREVAEKFECSLAEARTVLMSIRNGTSGDDRFKINPRRADGVLISDGSTWTYSPMDVGGKTGRHDRSPKHYIWFAS
jgi:hypothetical protein